LFGFDQAQDGKDVTEISRGFDKDRIVVGEPLPFSVFGADRKLLLAEGSTVNSPLIRDRLIRHGVFSAGTGSPASSTAINNELLDEPLANPLLNLSRDYRDIVRRARFGVKISPHDSGESYLCWVIGISHRNRCLVLTAPARTDGALVPVINGQQLICRLFNATTVFRFTGFVLKTAFEPFAYLHVGLPHTIERRIVRKVPRALVNLQATLHTPEEHFATVVDLSVTGARVGVDKHVSLQLGAPVKFTSCLQLLDKAQDIELQGSIVTTHGAVDPQHPGIVFYGVKFESPSQIQQLMLHGYVQQQLVSELDGLGQLLMMDSPASSK
jgi:hypothetical protein